MFGYVLPVKCELAPADFDAYRAVYCGLCKELAHSYGTLSRFYLNYDLVLLALLADALSGEEGENRSEGCFANPLQKRPTLYHTGGLSLAADALVLLSYHKMADGRQDETPPRSLLYGAAGGLLRKRYEKARTRLPHAASIIEAQMAAQQALEERHCYNLDEAADPTARMCEALFFEAARTPAQQKAMARLGLFAGQVAYLLDAAEDYGSDKKRGRYNVLIEAGYTRAEAAEAVKERCRMAAGEIALCYNLLPVVLHKPILDNIFFLGLPRGIAAAGMPRGKDTRGDRHGQIDRR